MIEMALDECDTLEIAIGAKSLSRNRSLACTLGVTDRAIAGQLRALTDDYQRRAEKASHVDAAKALARSAANAEGEWADMT
jgi:hypothetical protein